MLRSIVLVSAVTLAGLSGCNREAPATGVKPSASTAQPGAEAKSSAAAAITRIVFVDLDKCCDCTRQRIEQSWKALTDVVGYPPVPDVERIHLDSQADKAKPYQQQRPIMVPPAIYFFDQRGQLVQMLQGEVKSEQIRKLLGT